MIDVLSNSSSPYMALFAALISLLCAVMMYRSKKNATKVDENKAHAEEQNTTFQLQTAELTRTYTRLDDLEAKMTALQQKVATQQDTIEQLQDSDRLKQKTIDSQQKKIESQAGEMDHTNRLLTAVRTLFVTYAARVEAAWKDRREMPTLTPDERHLLEDATV